LSSQVNNYFVYFRDLCSLILRSLVSFLAKHYKTHQFTVRTASDPALEWIGGFSLGK